SIGAAPKEAIPELVLMLGESDSGAPLIARQSLNQIEPDWVKKSEARSAIPRLVARYTEGRNDASWDVLREFGTDWPTWEVGHRTLATLIAALSSSDWRIVEN